MATLSPLEVRALAVLQARVAALLGARLAGLVLFGSRARGHSADDSDLDVLVLARDVTLDERRAVQDAAYDVSLAEGVEISTLIRPLDFATSDLPLARAIARDGVPL